VTEQPASKDYRSFAANVFGSVAFKMLEWLTPGAIEEMSKKARPFQSSPDDADRSGRVPEQNEVERKSESRTPVPKQRPGDTRSALPAEPNDQWKRRGSADLYGKGGRDKSQKPEGYAKEDTLPRETTPVPAQRRNSNAKVRTPAGPKPKRQLSIDPFASDPLVDDPFAGLLRSPRANSGAADRNTRGIKTTNSTLSRPISQLSSAGYFDDVTLERMPPPKTVDFKLKVNRTQLDGARSTESSSPHEAVASDGSSARSCSHSSTQEGDAGSEAEEDNLYPQALSRLNADIVDFICDVIQKDGTAEKHMFEPQTIVKFHTRFDVQGKPLKRKSHGGRGVSANVRLEWKLFAEQTLFYVLSDPQRLIQSFSAKGQLYDSLTLWYCMLRMTRIAPSLVFQSLWMAASSLFAPPKSLQALRSPTAKLFPKREKSLSNAEAGRLLSICLHALVAAAPMLTDAMQISDMSRIRSHGLSLAGSGSLAQQPAELCLQYEDAFTDELALRLARRLFAALVARRCYDEMGESNGVSGHSKEEADVLTPLFSQLDFLNTDAAYIFNFSFSDRAVHEQRVPILLLDWARAVLLRDWDGSPEVPGDGSFGGALALIDSICKCFC